jgi:hypothetical protein
MRRWDIPAELAAASDTPPSDNAQQQLRTTTTDTTAATIDMSDLESTLPQPLIGKGSTGTPATLRPSPAATSRCGGKRRTIIALGSLGVAVLVGTIGAIVTGPHLTNDPLAAAGRSDDGLLAATTSASGCQWAAPTGNIHSDISWPCDEGDADTATFSLPVHSVNQDSVNVAWGWCASTDDCSGTFDNANCLMATDSFNDNLPHTFGGDSSNGMYKANVACMQLKCNNWMDDCQLVFDAISIIPQSVDSVPPQVGAAQIIALEGDSAADDADLSPCQRTRRRAWRALGTEIDSTNAALEDYKTTALRLRLAVTMALRAFAAAELAYETAELAYETAITALNEATAAAAAAQERYTAAVDAKHAVELDCQADPTTPDCVRRLADADAEYNEAAKINTQRLQDVADARAAVAQARADLDAARTRLAAARAALKAAQDGERSGLAGLQQAIRAAAQQEQDAFDTYLQAVKDCPPTTDDIDMAELHTQLQLQLAAVGATATTNPDADAVVDPLPADWEQDAADLGITAANWDQSTVCPALILSAWRNFRSASTDATTALDALKTQAPLLQAAVDAAQAAYDAALELLRQARAARDAAAQAVDDALAEQKAYLDGEWKEVQQRCAGDQTESCRTELHDANAQWGLLSVKVSDAQAALNEAQAAVAAARAALATAKDQLDAAYAAQKAGLQTLQDAINAAIQQVISASRLYRRTVRACNRRADADVDAVVSTDGVPTNATETQIQQTMAQLVAYANFTLPAPAPAPAPAAGALEIAGSTPKQAEAAIASPTVAVALGNASLELAGSCNYCCGQCVSICRCGNNNDDPRCYQCGGEQAPECNYLDGHCSDYMNEMGGTRESERAEQWEEVYNWAIGNRRQLSDRRRQLGIASWFHQHKAVVIAALEQAECIGKGATGAAAAGWIGLIAFTKCEVKVLL